MSYNQVTQNKATKAASGQTGMPIIKELEKYNATFGNEPLWLGELVNHKDVWNDPGQAKLRLTSRTHLNEYYFCFEDNSRMLRLLVRRIDDVLETLYFSMPTPNKTRPVRPAWALSHQLRFDIKDVGRVRDELLVYFKDYPSPYPLQDRLKINVNDNPEAMLNPKEHRSDNPTYFCGKILGVYEEPKGQKRLFVEGSALGQVVTQEIMIAHGRYYGKNPNRGDWVIFKQDHLTAIVSKRELMRYYRYVDSIFPEN